MAFFAFQIARIFVPSDNVYSIYTMENIYHVDGKRVYDEIGMIDTTFRFKNELDMWLEERTAYESQLQNTDYLQWMLESGTIHVNVHCNEDFDWYDPRYDPKKNVSIIYTDRDTTFEIGFTNMYDNYGTFETFYFQD